MSTTVQIKRGDTARKIVGTLLIDDQPIDLTGTTVKLVFRRDLSTETVTRDATITDAEAGEVEYQLVAEDTETAGTYFLEWHVSGLVTGLLRVPTDGYHYLQVQEDVPEA